MKKTPIEVICGDVVSTDLSDGTVYFLFNPFGRNTLGDVLSNIRRSLDLRARPVKFVYYNQVYGDLLASSGWLRCFHRFTTNSGRVVAFWKSVAAGAGDSTQSPNGESSQNAA